MIYVHKQNGKEMKLSKEKFNDLPQSVKEMYRPTGSTPPEAVQPETEEAKPKRTRKKKTSSEDSEDETKEAGE